MKALAAAAFILMASGAHAQVYKCPGPDGKISYSQAPCPAGGGQMDKGQLQSNTLPSAPAQPQRSTRRGNVQAEGGPKAVVIGGGTPGCPDDNDVRNLEVSANSILLDRYDKAVHAEQVARARACKAPLSASEVTAMREQLKREHLKSMPAAPQQSGSPRAMFCSPAGAGTLYCF
jgi:hypothetical protein